MGYGYIYSDLLKKTRIYPGDTVGVMMTRDCGHKIGIRRVKVLEVYRHHAVLDFGKWKESRRIADIALGLVSI